MNANIYIYIWVRAFLCVLALDKQLIVTGFKSDFSFEFYCNFFFGFAPLYLAYYLK